MDGQSFEQVLVPTGARLTDAGFSLSMRGTSPIRDSLGLRMDEFPYLLQE